MDVTTHMIPMAITIQRICFHHASRHLVSCVAEKICSTPRALMISVMMSRDQSRSRRDR